MKQFNRLIALLLCVSMVLCLFGCDTAQEPTEPTVTEPVVTEPPAPDAAEVYANARAKLDGADALTLDITVTTSTTLADQLFTQQSGKVLTYSGIGTEELMVAMEENIAYNIHEEDEEEEEDDEELPVYTEVYTGGTVYIEMSEDYRFASPLTAEECAARYLPPVLLDAALYESLSAERSGNNINLRFDSPTAPESWAVPEGAELMEAAGSAQVNANGDLTEMTYTVTYRYGSSEIKLEVQSRPRASAEAVTAPEKPDSYTMMQYADALRAYIHAAGMLAQASSVTTSSLESVFCQAAGVVRNQSTLMDLHGRGKDVMTKVETNIFVKDYPRNQEQRLEQREVYRDTRYVVTVDDGVPTSQVGIPHETIEEYCYSLMISHLNTPDFWVDAEMTDLGSVMLLEFTCSEDFGNSMQNAICNTFWEDPSFLNKLASAYVTNETTSYIAFDKYSGIPTAAGYYYEGTHTIEGADYTLSLQSDQSIEAPSLGAYFEITEEMPEEKEPEVKATPLFYHVTGPDGQEMWLLGTIHVGDERTAYLPQEIKDAFAASDALALECDSKAFDEQMEEDDDLSAQVSDLYYFSDGNTVESLIAEFEAEHSEEETEEPDESGETDMEEEEDTYAMAVKLMKATGNYNMNIPYAKPYLWSSSIENFYLRQGYQLHGDQGVEERLHAWAEEMGKEIREVESSLFQIEMLTGFSNDLQLLLLADAMNGDAQEYWTSVMDLYEKWCAGDEAVLREELSDEVDMTDWTEEEIAEYEEYKPLLDEYNKAMSYDRNDGMLKVAIEYLESGEVVFYAVGLAHLLNDVNGLVDALRDAGYTVELVQYS